MPPDVAVRYFGVPPGAMSPYLSDLDLLYIAHVVVRVPARMSTDRDPPYGLVDTDGSEVTGIGFFATLHPHAS